MDRNTLLRCAVDTALSTTGTTDASRSGRQPPLRIDRLAHAASEAGLEEAVFSLSVSILDTGDPLHDIYLQDLAEWLLLPPTTLRAILRRPQHYQSRAA